MNLSFELQSEPLVRADQKQPEALKQLEDAEYEFWATVLKIYSRDEPVVVIQMRDFRCYVACSPKRQLEFKVGDRVRGRGRLLLDHYLWVEYLRTYDGAPDLFYNLRVNRIRAVKIPESFIHRSEKGLSHPCSLKPGQYTSSDVRDVESMEDMGCQFYLVDFDSAGVEKDEIPRTFLS